MKNLSGWKIFLIGVFALAIIRVLATAAVLNNGLKNGSFTEEGNTNNTTEPESFTPSEAPTPAAPLSNLEWYLNQNSQFV